MAKAPASRPSTSSPQDPLTIPRVWLYVLVILLVAPWVVVGGLYLRRSGPPAVETQALPSASPRQAGTGPWGRLTLTPIVISPPLEYVSADWGRGEPARWAFPGVSIGEVRAFLTEIGATTEQVTLLQQAAQQDSATGAVTIAPSPALVRSLSAEVRARLYTVLAKSPLNFDQAQSFRFLGATADDWFSGSLMSPATRALVTPLLYRDGPFLHFADIESIRGEVGGPTEMQRLAKTLLRSATVLVALSISQVSDVTALSDYWGIGGRRTDIRPLLESIAGQADSRSIDIVHLLPLFARSHLYRYPKITTEDLNRPVLANCLWSSLNFFRDAPDDRFLDVETALAALRKDYFVVEAGYQLGDIVALVDEQGDLFHVAVHLADGLVFTKNGTSPVSPWTIMALPDLTAFYKRRTDAPRLIYHRLKSL